MLRARKIFQQTEKDQNDVHLCVVEFFLEFALIYRHYTFANFNFVHFAQNP